MQYDKFRFRLYALITGKHPKIDKIGEKNPQYSYCHGWTAAANVLLPMGIGGVTPCALEYKKVRICPGFDALDSFTCVQNCAQI